MPAATGRVPLPVLSTCDGTECVDVAAVMVGSLVVSVLTSTTAASLATLGLAGGDCSDGASEMPWLSGWFTGEHAVEKSSPGMALAVGHVAATSPAVVRATGAMDVGSTVPMSMVIASPRAPIMSGVSSIGGNAATGTSALVAVSVGPVGLRPASIRTLSVVKTTGPAAAVVGSAVAVAVAPDRWPADMWWESRVVPPVFFLGGSKRRGL